MNGNKLNTDEFTKELISKVGIQEPSPDFTVSVMSKILKDPAVNIHFITKDDKKSNIWLAISIGIMVLGSFIFYFLKYGFDFSHITNSAEASPFLNTLVGYFSTFWNELSLSPYILIALIGVIFLVLIDKTIVKFIYHI